MCANKPPAVKSRSRADFISKLKQKMSHDISSGIDEFGLDAKMCKNIAQAAPMDSFSSCSKSRMSVGRESVRSVNEND